MHKLLWLAVLIAVWGCNQSSSQAEPEPKPKLSVAEFALQPERKEPSDIRTEHEKSKEQDRKRIQESAGLYDMMTYAKPEPIYYEEIFPEAIFPVDTEIDLSDKSVPLEEKLNVLLRQLELWQEELFKMSQKEEWKQSQQSAWKQWVQDAPVQEQYQAFESIVKKMINLSDCEFSRREELDGGPVLYFSDQKRCFSEDAKVLEKAEFLQQLFSALPKPWKQTGNSFTFCEEVSGEECIKGAKFVSWRDIKDDDFNRTETTTVSCQKGFFENGDCRLGYNRVTVGEPRTYVSCDTYFNGKCYGNFNSFVVETDMGCMSQPFTETEIRIKKSDFDGTWGYYQYSVGCKEEYKLWCYRFDPKTLVCQDGFYQELGLGRLDSNFIRSWISPDALYCNPFLEGCVPDKDLLSCEVKDGVCVNEKIIKGREPAGRSGKKKEFRLTLPNEYAFE